MNIKLIEIKSADTLSLFEKEWNCLVSISHCNTVFHTYQWVTTLFNSFNENKRLKIYFLKINDEAAAIVPFQIGKSNFRNLPVKEIGFIENDEVPRFDFILRHDVTQKHLFDFLMTQLISENTDSWDIIRLRNIPETSNTLTLLTDYLTAHQFKYIIKRSLNSPFILIDRSWEGFLKTKGQHFRKRMRNTLNRIDKKGTITVVQVTSADEFTRHLDEIKNISEKSWLHNEHKDIFGDRKINQFFIEFSKIAAQSGWLSVWLLFLNNKAIAFEYHLTYGSSIHALRSGYDREYGDFSPGSVLEYNIIKHHFETYNGKQLYYDLCGGKDFYKTRWTDDIKAHQNIIIFNKTVYASLLYSLEDKIIAFVKKSLYPQKFSPQANN
jgi:hypothetical protein